MRDAPVATLRRGRPFLIHHDLLAPLLSEPTFHLNKAAFRSAPWTDAQNAILSDEALAAAARAIKGWPGYAPTPLVDLPGLAAEIGVAALAYKDEGPRFGLGSFKALGGAYAVERVVAAASAKGEQPGGVTVCCATDGNHGRSVAWGAKRAGCRCVIFIHATVSEGRAQAIEAYGAEVRRTDGNYDDSVREAEATAAREGWTVVSDTSYPGYMDIPKDVMQGYELMAAEAFDALGAAPSHIFLQAGVGGMAAAVASVAKRRWGAERPRIVLAEPEDAACWAASYDRDAPTAVDGDLDTIMAGLACGEVSLLAWEILRDHGDAAIALPDSAAAEEMRRLARPSAGDPPIVAGESAVAGLAGLRAAMAAPRMLAALALDGQSRVLVFGTEADTDPAVYQAIVGMSADMVRQGA